MYKTLDEALDNLYHHDDMTRREVAKYLSQTDDTRALSALITLYNDAHIGVRGQAYISLLKKDAQTVIAFVHSSAPECKSDPGYKLLIEASLSSASRIERLKREQHAKDLGETRDPQHIDTLAKMLHDPEENVRDSAASALVNINDVRAIQPLIDCFIDPKRKSTPDGDGDVSWHIPFCIKDFGPRAIPYIVPYLNNPSDAWKKGLLWLLYQMAEPGSVQPLIDAYKRCTKEDDLPKHTILSALKGIGTPEAKAFLASLPNNKKGCWPLMR